MLVGRWEEMKYATRRRRIMGEMVKKANRVTKVFES